MSKFNRLNQNLLNYNVFTPEDSQAQTQIPLLILHGLLGSMDNWRTQAKRLSINRPVIIMDLRNHGSSPHLKGMSYREMYEDVIKVVEHLNIERFNLLGHSMGGKVAMQLALSGTDLVNSLIIVDIAPRPYPLWHQQTLESVINAPIASLESRQEIDAHLEKSIKDPTERGFMMKNLRRANATDNPNSGFRWKCNLDEITKGYLKIAGFSTAEQKYLNKALFVSGGDSPYIREQDYSLINSLFPKSTIITINNAGHLPHFQQADEFFERVDTFLQELN